MRYLFGDSVIFTGNDNSCDPEDACFTAEDTIWNDGELISNPNYHPDKYDYFFKGN